MTMQNPYSEINNNFKMVTEEHETKRGGGTSEPGPVRVHSCMPKKLTLGNNLNLHHGCH